jgi:hypothetical protein
MTLQIREAANARRQVRRADRRDCSAAEWASREVGRNQVVPAVPARSPRAAVQLTLVQAGQPPVSQLQDDASPATRHPWSMLLKHVFAVDVTVCVTCGGPMRLLSLATTPKAIGRAVYRAGLGPQPPPIARQRVADKTPLR